MYATSTAKNRQSSLCLRSWKDGVERNALESTPREPALGPFFALPCHRNHREWIMHDGWCEKPVAHAASLKLASARTFLTHSLSRPSVSAIRNSSGAEKCAQVSGRPCLISDLYAYGCRSPVIGRQID